MIGRLTLQSFAIKFTIILAFLCNPAHASCLHNCEPDASTTAFIKRVEGESLVIYKDSKGLDTICVGHLVTKADHFPIPFFGCEALLRKDLAVATAGVKRSVNVPMEQTEFTAIESIFFNMGNPKMSASTLVEMLNAEDRLGAALQFLLWDKINVRGKKFPVHGLTVRRKLECHLFKPDAC